MVAKVPSFLARLTRGRTPSGVAAIVRNLDHLLNTRKGCGSVVAGLGLGDYEAAPTTHRAVLLLRSELEQLVKDYEPRLGEPRVTLLGRSGIKWVRFELQGRIGDESHVLWLDIDTSTRHFVVTVGAKR